MTKISVSIMIFVAAVAAFSVERVSQVAKANLNIDDTVENEQKSTLSHIVKDCVSRYNTGIVHYEIDFVSESQIKITYYKKTEDSHLVVCVETLDVIQEDGFYKVEKDQIKQYEKITSATEFDEAYGTYAINDSWMDYTANGLGKSLSERKLLTPESAAPYLLNLAGGKCKVKEVYEELVIVTYEFQDGSTMDFSMIQPYGRTKQDNWVVKNQVDEEDEAEIAHSRQIVQTITGNQLEEMAIDATRYIDDELTPGNGQIVELINQPEENITFYSLNGYKETYGTILRVGDTLQYFDWELLNVYGELPQIKVGDYDKDGENEISICTLFGTGTGVSVTDLYILEPMKDGTYIDFLFKSTDYDRQIRETIKDSFEEEQKTLCFLNQKDGSELKVDLTESMSEDNGFAQVCYTGYVNFTNAGSLKMEVACSYLQQKSFGPFYDNMPEIQAKVNYSEESFRLDDLQLTNLQD